MFTGQQVDILDGGALKIQYNRNRYYDYYTGRWTTQDPLGYVDGLNVYEYVQSKPVRYVDPFGFEGCSQCGVADAGLGLGGLATMSVRMPRIPILPSPLPLNPWPYIRSGMGAAARGLCWAAEEAVDGIVRNELDAAWKHFTGRSLPRGDVRLSDADMAIVFKQYKIRKKIIEPLADRCRRSGYDEAWEHEEDKGMDYRSLGYGESGYSLDGSWGATLGGVSVHVIATCSCRTLTWDISFRDTFDFDNHWRGLKHLPRNIIVTLVDGTNGTLNCGWQNFDFYGAAKGKEAAPCDRKRKLISTGYGVLWF